MSLGPRSRQVRMESLRGMVSFVQTAREGSFVGAAKALGITAVAVSRNVARLEQQLGVRLFARTTRKLSLSAEGAALLAQCEAPLDQLASAFQASRDAMDTPSGRVRVTAVSPFARTYLMPMLGEFCARYPKVELDIALSEQVTDLVAERFDVGIRVGQLRDASFVARPLGPLRLAICASPAYLAAAGVPLTIADLARHPALLLLPAGANSASPWRLQAPGGATEMAVSGPLRCNDLAALAEACCAGLGLAQLPLVVALPALRTGRLKVVLPGSSPQGLQLFMHYPDRQLPARVRVFVEFVASRMRTHPDLDIDPATFAAATPRPGGPAQPAARPAPNRTADARDRAQVPGASVAPATRRR
jgi:DNA-binding transcriptional LysR family regulator